MRAWVAGDVRTLRRLTARDFRMVFATRPCVILDAPSWLKAAADRFVCDSYRFGDTYVSRCRSISVFAAQLHLEASVQGVGLSGTLWVTSVWAKTGMRRRWQVRERAISRLDDNAELPRAVASLQLWR